MIGLSIGAGGAGVGGGGGGGGVTSEQLSALEKLKVIEREGGREGGKERNEGGRGEKEGRERETKRKRLSE